MRKRTWPYGTILEAEVLHLEVLSDGTRIMALKDERGEGHFLVGTDSDEAEPGDKGLLQFCQGGPTGGYWRFRKWQLNQG